MVIWMDRYLHSRHAASPVTRRACEPRTIGAAGSASAQAAPSAALRAAACLVDPTFAPSCDATQVAQLYARASLV